MSWLFHELTSAEKMEYNEILIIVHKYCEKNLNKNLNFQSKGQ